MTTQWYLLPKKLKGTSIGPLTAARLLELATAEGTAPDDWVSLEGTDVQIPVERFLAMVGAGDDLPTWLNDVARCEALLRSGPQPEPAWLEEVEQNEKFLLQERASMELPLDWLEDIGQIEASLRPAKRADTQPLQPKAKPRMPVADAFLEAQRLFQDWVHAQANQSLVTKSGLKAIQNHPAVQEILQRYESYGLVMKEKLLKRLALLVDKQKQMQQAGTK